jgi:hypothetical protein
MVTHPIASGHRFTAKSGGSDAKLASEDAASRCESGSPMGSVTDFQRSGIRDAADLPYLVIAGLRIASAEWRAMRIEQQVWKDGAGWVTRRGAATPLAQLVLVFGERRRLEAGDHWDHARATWPGAAIVSCSTAGEIAGTNVFDDTIVATAVEFQSTHMVIEEVTLDHAKTSRGAGEILGARLSQTEELRHVLVLSDGIHVNGSDLVRGMSDRLPEGVAISGGLAGDATRFERTFVSLGRSGDAPRVVAVGLCGPRLRVGYGSLGGWDPFGPSRLVTRSSGNVLYELDGQPALELYRRYLGDAAAELPASALLFPLALSGDASGTEVVRTVLGVSQEDQSMTFAGDIPSGWRVRLMRANFDRLLDGAAGAARASSLRETSGPAELALLVSCVGRKLVLKQRIEEEVEAAQTELGPIPVLAGFYSYGEISPFTPSARCELHNQTMTITTLREE